MTTLFGLVGWVGAELVLLAYALVATKRLSALAGLSTAQRGQCRWSRHQQQLERRNSVSDCERHSGLRSAHMRCWWLAGPRPTLGHLNASGRHCASTHPRTRAGSGHRAFCLSKHQRLARFIDCGWRRRERSRSVDAAARNHLDLRGLRCRPYLKHAILGGMLEAAGEFPTASESLGARCEVQVTVIQSLAIAIAAALSL